MEEVLDIYTRHPWQLVKHGRDGVGCGERAMCRSTDRRGRDAPARDSSEGALSGILNRALVNWRFTTKACADQAQTALSCS
jgi:hypothetical protein